MAYENTSTLYHHGVRGQKWGIRRYQNKDGTLTPAGRKRAEKLEKNYKELTGKKLSKTSKLKEDDKAKPKSIKDMTNDELREKTTRMRLENDYVRESTNMQNLNPEKVSIGKRLVSHTWKNVVSPAATEAGKRLLTDWLIKTGDDALELHPKKINPNDTLKKEVETLELERRKLRASNDIANMRKKKN